MKKIQPLYAVLLTLFLLYAFSSNPSDSNTGAPGDSNCTSCHGNPSSSFDGSVTLQGLPNDIIPGTTYKVSVVTKATAGSPSSAGFQMVVLDGAANNAGDLMNPSNNSTLTLTNGRNYFEHNPALSFNSADSVAWSVDWTAPSTLESDSIKIYINSILGNGSGSSNDLMVSSKTAYNFQTVAAEPVVVKIEEIKMPTCFGEEDGLAQVSASGGTGSFTYLWSNEDTTAMIVNLAPNNYTVTVTDTDGATGTATVTINQPDDLIITIDSVRSISCATPNGQATANVTGGTPPYSYLWSNDTTTATADLTSGMHTVTVTDDNGCQQTAMVMIEEDLRAPVANAGIDQQLDCENTTTTLDGSASSQGTDITYSWTTMDGNIISEENTLMPTITSAGTYILTVNDTLSGCNAVDTAIVTQDAALPMVSVEADRVINCADSDTLAIVGSASIGDNITYIWTTEGGQIIGDTTTLTTTIVGTGTYTLTATDTTNSCSTNATLSVSMATPPTADAGMSATINCANLEIILNGSASIGEHLIFDWTTTEGNIKTGNATATPTVDALGTYTLTVTDTLTGCNSTASVVVTQDAMTTLFAASGDAEQLTCTQSMLTLNANASTGENIIYIWTTENGNILEGGNTLMPTINAPGKYVLTARDTTNGCFATSSIKIAEDVNLPTVMAEATQNIDCNTSTVTLRGSSDTEFNLTYIWTTENGNIVNGANTPMPEVNAAGSYTLTVTDTFTNCSNIAMVEVLADATVPMANAGTAALQLDCNNDTLTLAGSGSEGENFITLWTTQDGNLLDDATIFTPRVDGAGTYILTVTDTTSGCSSSATAIVTTNVEKPMVEAGAAEQVFCDNSTLAISATASMGDNFTYFWCTEDGSILSGSEALDVVIDGAGLFEFIVTNTANGCKNADTLIVTSLESPMISLDTMNDTSLVITGGLTPYIYNFRIDDSISLETNSLIVLEPGNYDVMVTDANGCVDNIQFIIETSTSINALDEQIESFVLFPNPTNDYLNVNIDFNNPQNGSIFIMNKIGQQVWHQSFSDKNINLEVDVVDWSAGIYYMLIQTAEGMKTAEIVVVK